MSGNESEGLVSKKLLDGMTKSRPSKKKTKRRRPTRETRPAPFNGMKRMQVPSRRKRRISRKSSKSSKTVQARGKNVDSLFEKDTRSHQLPSSPLATRVVSFQEISSGRAAVSKLSASSLRCEFFRVPEHLSPRDHRSKSFTSKKEGVESNGNTRTSLSKEDECRTPQSLRDDDDIFLQSINVEFPNDAERDSSRVFPEQSWSKDKRSSMGSALGTYISCFSDWNDDFIGWDEESYHSPELTSASRHSWGSDLTSPMERSLFLDEQYPASEDGHRIRSKLTEEEGSPEGMILVIHINSKSGNRFSNFPVDCLLLEVTNWLGESLPVYIDGEGNARRRRCKPNCSLLDCFGKSLEKPEKWGLACFVGPVNGKVCWVIKVCELSRLNGLRMSTKGLLRKETDGIEENPTYQTPVVSVKFKPGRLGMSLGRWLGGFGGEHTGEVTDVSKHGQAQLMGVKVGWTIIGINDKPFTEKLLDTSIGGSSPYILTFKTPQKKGRDFDAKMVWA